MNEVVVVIGHLKSAEVSLPDQGWAQDSVANKESNGTYVIATHNIKNQQETTVALGLSGTLHTADSALKEGRVVVTRSRPVYD